MHSFQDIDFGQLEINPFETIGNDWMLVTAGSEEKVNTMTASWGGMGVMWGRNVAFVFIRESRYTKEFIDREGAFSLSFPKNSCRREMKFLGTVSGRDEDKINEVNFHVGFMDGIPYIDEGVMLMFCRVMAKMPVEASSFIDSSLDAVWYKGKDYHTMYIAEITGVYVR